VAVVAVAVTAVIVIAMVVLVAELMVMEIQGGRARLQLLTLAQGQVVVITVVTQVGPEEVESL
jgi:hypothetical protein